MMNSQQLTTPQKSNEAFFGENNPLVNSMVPHIDLMRSICISAIKRNPTIKNSELVAKITAEGNALAEAIRANFNIEKCTIGYTSANNFYSIGSIWNSKLYTKDGMKYYDKLKTGIDELVETKDGYRFKDKSGVYFNIIISINVFKNDEYTSREIIGLIIHEIGHCMCEILDGVDLTVLENYTNRLVKGNFELDKNTSKAIAEEIQRANTEEEINKTAKQLISQTSIDERNAIDSENADSKYLTEFFENSGRRKLDAPNSVQYKPSFFQRLAYGIGNAFFSIIVLPFLIPKIMKREKEIETLNETNYDIKQEAFADEMAKAYGVGVDLTSALKKYYINKKYSSVETINKSPMFDFYSQYKRLRTDYENAVCGYPSDMQRVVNNYVSCKFELDNNPDLTPQQKAEILKQINALKAFYDDYVYDAKTNGALYRAFAKSSKRAIEDAAERDTAMRKNILEPLQERSNKYYKI